ncbi:conserved hypothetical protein [Gammaproteobacteria bacterium]
MIGTLSYALVLQPVDPLVCINTLDSRHALQTLGLIKESSEVTSSSEWYSVGSNFLEHITFLGCSPVVYQIMGENDIAPFRVHLPFPLENPVWYVPEKKISLRCPKCHTQDFEWRTDIPKWMLDPLGNRRTCTHCAQTFPLHQWRLREEIGFGRSFLEFWGIHPGEAVPGDVLLGALVDLSGSDWRWFYRS